MTESEMPSFARTFLAPALFVLMLPIVGATFTTWKLHDWSESMRASFRMAAAEDANAPTGEALDAFLAAAHVGDLALASCGSLGFFNEPDDGPSSLCTHVLQFVWVKRVSFALLALAALLALILTSTIRSIAHNPLAQRRGFLLGWTSLRLFGIPHIIGQGVILLFLSFWVTAIFFEIYVVKLIIIAACLAVAAAFTALKALFAKSDFNTTEHGVVLSHDDAPSFFAHMRALADRVGTSPPEAVVVGIDDNFFVTEMPFFVTDGTSTRSGTDAAPKCVSGRTLYTSLSLMRALSRDESDAILAHELAHFRAGDTAMARELNPLLRQFDAFMTTLQDTFTFGVGACLLAFRAFFERAARVHGRAAEFAADRVSRDVVGARPTAHALWKTAAYSTYRGRVENELFSSMKQESELKLAERVSHGFVSFVADPEKRTGLLSDVLAVGMPHPFDTHPPLADRLRMLGENAPSGDELVTMAERPATTLCDDIPHVSEIEQTLWGAYEAAFSENHNFAIALRLVPTTPDEIAHVERHFPPTEHTSKEGVVRLDWRRIALVDGTELAYDDIESAETKDLTFGGKGLVLKTKAGPSHTVKLAKFADKGAALLASYGTFWQRHHVSQNENAPDREASDDDHG
jgi:Zn-dependent protease with chaperone function